MSNIALRKRRHTTTELSTLTLPAGEVMIDTVGTTLVVGDGVTAGGIPLAVKNHTHSNATQAASGFLSAADKTKLDGLANQLTVFYDPSGASQTARIVYGTLTIPAPSGSYTSETANLSVSNAAVFSSSSSYVVMVNSSAPGIALNATPVTGSTFTISAYSLNGNALPAIPVNFIAIGN